VRRYLFERKGIRVIACCRTGRTITGAREEKQRVILLHHTHCSKKQNQRNGSQALPLSHWGFLSLSHSLRIQRERERERKREKKGSKMGKFDWLEKEAYAGIEHFGFGEGR